MIVPQHIAIKDQYGRNLHWSYIVQSSNTADSIIDAIRLPDELKRKGITLAYESVHNIEEHKEYENPETVIRLMNGHIDDLMRQLDKL